MSPNSVDFNFSRSSHLQLIILQISQVEQQAKDLKDQPFDLQSSSSHQTDHNLRLASKSTNQIHHLNTPEFAML
ncbi:hypothetical protein R6Q59_036047 [Mikania micrantha]